MFTSCFRIAVCLFALSLSTNVLAQSKKEQIETLTSEIDSLKRVVQLKENQINELSNKNSKQENTIQSLEEKNRLLAEQITQKEKQIEALTNNAFCPSAKTDIEIIPSASEEEPILQIKSTFKGVELFNYRSAIQGTYPNRAYSFEYFITGVNCGTHGMYEGLTVSLLFNDKIQELEAKINARAKEDLMRHGVAEKDIPVYRFGRTNDENKINKIHFFIAYDEVTFYLDQHNLELNDRLEISYPLQVIAPYLVDFESMTLEQRRMYCLEKGQTLILEMILSNVETGDMSTYIEFMDPKTQETLSFAFWNWYDKEMDMDAFADFWWKGKADPKMLFLLHVGYEKVKEYEYRGFDEGSVETGKLIDSYVLYKAIISP